VLEWEEIKEPAYETREISYVVCIDTMGQDRALTESEREFVENTMKAFISAWEESEKRNLTFSKNKKINNAITEAEFLDKEAMEIQEEEDKLIEDLLNETDKYLK
jgi:hypothetical protein